MDEQTRPLNLAPEIPIACAPTVFTEGQRQAHLALSIEALVRWPTRRQAVSDGYVFEYDGTEERFLALAKWAAGEHRCCPWAAYSLEMAPFSAGTPGAIRLHVRATAEGIAFLRLCYEYVEKLQADLPPDSLFHSERITADDVRRELARCTGC